MGPRFNIVSGSSGTVHTPAATKTYGHFYPNVGVFIMSANSLSASLGGHHEYLAEDAKTLQAGAFTNATGSGLAPDLRVSGSADNAAKLFVAFQLYPSRYWHWVLLTGIIGVMIAIFLFAVSAKVEAALLGYSVGFYLLLHGISLVFYSSALRGLTK